MPELNVAYKRKYYAYSYDKKNQVFLVRGVDPDYATNEMVNYVPSGLMEIMLREYIERNAITGLKLKEAVISYSLDHYYAVVDFKGRHFSDCEIAEINNEVERINAKKMESNSLVKKLVRKIKK